MDIKLIRFKEEHKKYIEYWEKEGDISNCLLNSRTGYQQELCEDSTQIFMVKADGRMIGCAWLEQIDYVKKDARLAVCFGEKKYRGKGTGEQLVKLVLNKAFFELRLNKVSLWVHEKNSGAINCYRKCGFKTTDRQSLSSGEVICEMTLIKSKFRT